MSVWDPHLTSDEHTSVEFLTDIDQVHEIHVVVLVTAHKACLELDWNKLEEQMNHSILYDGRRVWIWRH